MHEVFEHTADIGLRARAPHLNGVFAEIARAMFLVLVPNLEAVRPVQQRLLEVADEPLEDLLHDWLVELLYLFDTRHVVLCEFDVAVGRGLKATLRGEPLDRDRHQLGMEIKAVTYHELKLLETDAGWLAEVIVDI